MFILSHVVSEAHRARRRLSPSRNEATNRTPQEGATGQWCERSGSVKERSGNPRDEVEPMVDGTQEGRAPSCGSPSSLTET